MYSIYYDEAKGWKLEYCSFITIHLLVKLSTSGSDLVHVPKHQNSKKKYCGKYPRGYAPSWVSIRKHPETIQKTKNSKAKRYTPKTNHKVTGGHFCYIYRVVSYRFVSNGSDRMQEFLFDDFRCWPFWEGYLKSPKN